MPDNDEDIIVSFTLDDDGTGDPKIVAGEGDDPIADLKGQFASLQTSVQTANQRASAAEQRLSQTEQELATTRKEVVTSQLDTVTTGLQAAEQAADSAEAEYAAAFEAGDGKAMARAQRKIAEATSTIGRLKDAQEDLKETAKAPPKREDLPRRAAADPVEQFTANMSPRAAAWVKAHPECVTDRRQNARMMAAHHAALADGVEEGSDDYFAHLDEKFGAGGRQAPDPTRQAAKAEVPDKPVSRRPSAPVAPAGGGNGGRTPISVQLTAGERASATDGTLVWNHGPKKGEPIGLQEMARRKHVMKEQGQYDKTLTS